MTQGTELWLVRHGETATPGGFGRQAEYPDDLCEWDYGEYEGRTTKEIRQAFADDGLNQLLGALERHHKDRQFAIRGRVVTNQVQFVRGWNSSTEALMQ